MKKILFLLLFSLITVTSFADNNYQYQSTSLVGGRYEIIQSPIARYCFFRLDKETGNVWQYIKNDEGKADWQFLQIIGLESDSLYVYKDRINYQLFIGGIAAADVLLINVNNGVTYQLYEDTEKKALFFGAITDGLYRLNYFRKINHK